MTASWAAVKPRLTNNWYARSRRKSGTRRVLFAMRCEASTCIPPAARPRHLPQGPHPTARPPGRGRHPGTTALPAASPTPPVPAHRQRPRPGARAIRGDGLGRPLDGWAGRLADAAAPSHLRSAHHRRGHLRALRPASRHRGRHHGGWPWRARRPRHPGDRRAPPPPVPSRRGPRFPSAARLVADLGGGDASGEVEGQEGRRVSDVHQRCGALEQRGLDKVRRCRRHAVSGRHQAPITAATPPAQPGGWPDGRAGHHDLGIGAAAGPLLGMRDGHLVSNQLQASDGQAAVGRPQAVGMEG